MEAAIAAVAAAFEADAGCVRTGHQAFESTEGCSNEGSYQAELAVDKASLVKRCCCCSRALFPAPHLGGYRPSLHPFMEETVG